MTYRNTDGANWRITVRQRASFEHGIARQWSRDEVLCSITKASNDYTTIIDSLRIKPACGCQGWTNQGGETPRGVSHESGTRSERSSDGAHHCSNIIQPKSRGWTVSHGGIPADRCKRAIRR